jgi:hypothetical protein
MAGVVPDVQPSLLDPSSAINGQSKESSTMNGKDSGRKRAGSTSSFSLSYFEEDASTSIEEEPPKPLPKLPVIPEQKEAPKNNPSGSPQPERSTTPVDQEKPVDLPAEEEDVEVEEEKTTFVGGEDLMCLFTHDSFPHVKELALEGKLNNTNMRGVTWRVCFALFHKFFFLLSSFSCELYLIFHYFVLSLTYTPRAGFVGCALSRHLHVG